RAGVLTKAQRDAERAAWVAAWKKRTGAIYYGFVWAHGYAEYAETGDDAAEAMRVLRDFGAIPPYRPKTATKETIGHTLLLANRAAEAIPYLRKAAQSCAPLDFPLPFVRAHAWLGEALAATGDKAGACEALKSVATRWGDAKARTSALAREQRRQLG